MTPEYARRQAADSDELRHVRLLLEQERARVRELESAQAQLELYAEDIQRTFRELRRQLAKMSELHRISTVIGSVLEPTEVMARTLDGVGHLVAHDLACIYLLEDGSAVRRATRGTGLPVPPLKIELGDGPVGQVMEGAEAAMSGDGLGLTVPMRAGGTVVGVLHLLRRLDSADPLTDEDRKLAELVAAEAAAAIQNAYLYEQTRRLATTDPQTGLFNYRYFREALEMEVARARRLGYVVGLLMIDLDDFKRVNDTYGHLVGDEVLREVATTLRRNLRRTDVIVRYGGEEFSIILPGLGPSGVQAVAEQLRLAVQALPPLERENKGVVPITVSVGGTSQVPAVVDAVALVREADAALYEAKRRGKDRVHVGPPVGTAGPDVLRSDRPTHGVLSGALEVEGEAS